MLGQPRALLQQRLSMQCDIYTFRSQSNASVNNVSQHPLIYIL